MFFRRLQSQLTPGAISWSVSAILPWFKIDTPHCEIKDREETEVHHIPGSKSFRRSPWNHFAPVLPALLIVVISAATAHADL